MADTSDIFEVARFRKLCALLASPNAGERAAAACKATEMLQRHRLDWSDVVAAAFPDDRVVSRPSLPASSRYGAFADMLRRAAEPRSGKPTGRPSGHRRKAHMGLFATQLVMAIHAANPPLGAWESNFISSLMTLTVRNGSSLALTANQWMRLIEIGERSGIIIRAASGDKFILTAQGKSQWAER